MTVAIRPARQDDWPSVARLLVELGRGVAEGTAQDQPPEVEPPPPIGVAFEVVAVRCV